MSRVSPRRGLTSVLLLGGIIGSGLLLAAAPAPQARAASLTSYRAVANADAIRQGIVRPEAPVSDQVLDAGFPSVQAALDNLGNSQAYASLIYPGDTVVAGIGLASGLTGVPLPPYPLIAMSAYPAKPESDVGQGAFVMRASSGPQRSAGQGALEGAFGARFAASSTTNGAPEVGKLEALSRTDATGIDLANVLTIASVRSTAVASIVNGKPVDPTSTLQVGEIKVAGLALALTPQGLALPGQNSALPDTSAVLKPLADVGLSIELLQPELLEGGIRSGGVRIFLQQASPEGGSVTVSYTFGQSVAVVSAVADQSTSSPSTPAGPAVVDGAGPGEALPSTTPELAGVPAPGALPTTNLTINQGPSAVAQFAGADLPFTRMDIRSFYLVLAVAAAVAFAAQKALRRYGVS